MRIALVTPFLTRAGGGVFTSAQRLAQSLAAENDVQIFGLENVVSAEDLATWAPLRTQAFSVIGPRPFGYAPEMGRALKTAPADVVHAHGLWMYPSLAAHRSGKPSVVSPHGMLDPWALGNARWKKRLAGAVFQDAHLRAAACIHALCAAEADSIRAYGLRNPICIIPNGIDLPAPAADAPPWSTEIPRDAKVLLHLGRLHPKKGVPDLIRAWSAIEPPWHLVIAGWDQAGHEDELRRLAAEFRCARVHFPGPLFGAAKTAAYHHAAAFVLPSLSEGLPMVVLEAWAHGKPVLMTEECHLLEGFAAGAAIRIAPEPESIAEGLRALAALSVDELQAVGRRGRELVQQRFAWPQIARDFSAVYAWILQRGPQPACVVKA